MRGELLEAERRLELAVEIGAGLRAETPGDSARLLRLARSRAALARFWAATGREEEAEQCYLRALAEMEELVQQVPGRIAFLRGLADVQNELASLWMRAQRRDDALRGYERTLELQRRVVETAPEQDFYQEALSHAYSNLAFAQADPDPPAAERNYRSGLELSDRLAARHPEQPRFLSNAANDHDCLGSFLYEHQRGAEAEPEYEKALALRRALAEEHPEVPDYLSDLGGLLHNFSRIVRNRGELAEGRAMLEEAACLQLCALEKNPRNPLYRDYLLNHLEGLAETNLRLGEHRAAALEAEECLRASLEPDGERAFVARVLARCAGCAAGEPGLASGYSARALQELELALGRGGLEKSRLAQDAAFAALRGNPEFERLAR
jgi:tetratricopeptide (TPR) repeat protein